MRLTRLELLVGVVVVGGLGYAGHRYGWFSARLQPSPFTPYPFSAAAKQPPPKTSLPMPVAPASTPAVDIRQASAKMLANVGEAYGLVRKEHGDVPSIADPLRTAKSHWSQGRYAEAIASSGLAWAAVKDFRKTAGPPRLTYVVARGDTLWAIARDRSPTRQGPAWVGLWKANKNVIKNFDRLEVGTRLSIPQKPEDYRTAFWRPRPMPVARGQEVDLAELPIADDGEEVLLAELPLPREPSPAFTAAALKPPAFSVLLYSYHR